MSFTASSTVEALETNIQFCDLALPTNAALRRDVMRAILKRSETGTRCGIALKRFVIRLLSETVDTQPSTRKLSIKLTD